MITFFDHALLWLGFFLTGFGFGLLLTFGAMQAGKGMRH